MRSNCLATGAGNSRSRSGIVLVMLVLAFAGARAGDLEPPGAPAPTMKTLSEVEPRIPIHASDLPLTITTPGSYYLAENVTGAAGFHGIVVSTDHVTIDLRGFHLVGVPGSLNGIEDPSGGADNISVINGTVRDWGGTGISLDGISFLVRNVHVYGNGGAGLSVDVGSLVDDVVAVANGGDGILVGRGSVVSNCVATFNDGDGIRNLTGHVSVLHSVARANHGDGIEVGEGSYVLNNTSAESGFGGAFDGAAIHVLGSGTRVEGNNATASDRGIDVDAAGNLVIRNSASGNGTAYSIVAGNTVGPIVGVADPIASTNPWANFAF